MRSDGGQCLQESHEDLVVTPVLLMTKKPLKLLVNPHQDLYPVETDFILGCISLAV